MCDAINRRGYPGADCPGREQNWTPMDSIQPFLKSPIQALTKPDSAELPRSDKTENIQSSKALDNLPWKCKLFSNEKHTEIIIKTLKHKYN